MEKNGNGSVSRKKHSNIWMKMKLLPTNEECDMTDHIILEALKGWLDVL